MGEILGGSERRYEQDGTQIEKIIRHADALRVNYLEGNFWPVCGLIGGLLLFFIAAAIVPP
jgi:hypothetical protein